MNDIKKSSINEIADAVIERILESRDPFETPVVVFHNPKIAQWFKAYFLKQKSDVLMNVRFETLTVFVNDIVNPGRKHRVMEQPVFREFILKTLLTDPDYQFSALPADSAVRYIYDASGKVKGSLLFEFANKLAELFLRYELDEEKMSGWELALYKKVSELAAKAGYYTTKGVLDLDEAWSIPSAPVYVIDNAYISKLFEDILKLADDGQNRIQVYRQIPKEVCNSPVDNAGDLNSDKTCGREKLISAPSVLREVETVHSEICKIIRDNPKVRLNDIVVYAPKINLYVGAIKRVFNQYNISNETIKFPSIPACIVGESPETQNMMGALSVLFDVAVKRCFTRNDFFKFVKNPMVQIVHGFSDSDVEDWMNAIIETNTYRNKDEDHDDWDYLKKRVLLAEVVSDKADLEDKAIIDGKPYLPYSSIDLGWSSANKLIDMITKLQTWCDLFDNDLDAVSFDKAQLEKDVKPCLDELFSRLAVDETELNYLYRDISATLDRLIGLGVSLPASTLLRIILSVPGNFVSNPADMFASGVTFLNLSLDDTVGVPYVFVMGMSSKEYPRIEVKSELDLFSENKDLEKHSSEDLDRLAIQYLRANADYRTFSYVNEDLKRGEPFYPSSVIRIDPKTATVIPLDESRDYSELFTRKEFRNKENRDGTAKASSAGKTTPPPPKREDSLSLRDMKKFLENTLVYKFNKTMKTDEDQENDIMDEFEAIDVDRLTRHGLIGDLIRSEFGEGVLEKDQTLLTHRLPEANIGNPYWDEYGVETAPIIQKIRDEGYELTELEPLKLAYDDQLKRVEWTLTCKEKLFKKTEGSNWCYIEPVCPDDTKPSRFFLPFAFALMDVASQKTEEEYMVNLWVHPKKKDGKEQDPLPKDFSITPAKAIERLNLFHCRMTDFANMKYMDKEYLNDYLESKIKVPTIMAGLKEEVTGTYTNHSSWKYFADKQMVDFETECGYKDALFNEEFQRVLDAMKELVKELGLQE